MSHHDLLSYVKARWGKDQRKCDTCQHNKATLTCAACKDVQFCGAQACGADHRCLIGGSTDGNADGNTRDKKRVRTERVYDLNVIPDALWGIVTKYLSANDMKSLSLADKKRLSGIRTCGVARNFLWRITLDSYRKIRDNPWMKCIQRVIVDSLITLEALKYMGFTLTEVRLDNPIIEPLYPGLFPDTVDKVVIFYQSFNQPLAGLFPPSLRTLDIFTAEFNSSIDGLPVDLQHLSIQSNGITLFDQPITNLPPGLLSISLLSTFNQPIDGIFPQSLELIELGDEFDQPIPYFPNLKEITLQNVNIEQEEFDFPKGMKFINIADKSLTFK